MNETVLSSDHVNQAKLIAPSRLDGRAEYAAQNFARAFDGISADRFFFLANIIKHPVQPFGNAVRDEIAPRAI